jgi:hypothetical protein
MVGAVPLVTAHVEAAAQVARHRHETAVGAGHGHVRELRDLGKHDSHPVAVAVVPTHQVVALRQQPENLLAHVYATRGVEDPGVDAVRLGKIQEIGALAHGGLLE